MRHLQPFAFMLCLFFTQNTLAQSENVNTLIARGDSAYAVFDNQAALEAGGGRHLCHRQSVARDQGALAAW